MGKNNNEKSIIIQQIITYLKAASLEELKNLKVFIREFINK